MTKTWQEQLRSSPKSIADLELYFPLSNDEKAAIASLSNTAGLPLRVTPHFLSLIDPSDPEDPLRLQVIPRQSEFTPDTFDRRDPLGEEDHEVVPHLVHRYPDRVLLLITDRCASYCRFCTRKRWVGQGPTPKTEHLEQALAYVTAHSEIKEVIVSGGDALLLDDDRLEKLLSKIRQIPSVEIIRLASRMLTFAPMRVTENLLSILKRYQPIYILSHTNHPKEISNATETALLALADGGVPVLNQTVLLKGINDNAAVLTALFRHLTRLRARPYYLHQCDIAPGTAHFRVPLPEAQALVKSLRGHLSGLCQPTFVIDIPGGYGKVPMYPSPVVQVNDNSIVLEGFMSEQAEYPLD
ncbi:MAG: KamA family radical SAM protein [Myxococcota bacterium]